MAPNTTSVSHKYSRSELLKLRDFNNDSSHIDWSHVDAVLSPHSVQNIRGIKARITGYLASLVITLTLYQVHKQTIFNGFQHIAQLLWMLIAEV